MKADVCQRGGVPGLLPRDGSILGGSGPVSLGWG